MSHRTVIVSLHSSLVVLESRRDGEQETREHGRRRNNAMLESPVLAWCFEGAGFNTHVLV